jgi:hypothetical protein
MNQGRQLARGDVHIEALKREGVLRHERFLLPTSEEALMSAPGMGAEQEVEVLWGR